jgi:hypothetical protein
LEVFYGRSTYPTNENALAIYLKICDRKLVQRKKIKKRNTCRFSVVVVVVCLSVVLAVAAVCSILPGGSMPFLVLKFIVRLNEWNYAFPLSQIHRIKFIRLPKSSPKRHTIKLQPSQWGFNCLHHLNCCCCTVPLSNCGNRCCCCSSISFKYLVCWISF